MADAFKRKGQINPHEDQPSEIYIGLFDSTDETIINISTLPDGPAFRLSETSDIHWTFVKKYLATADGWVLLYPLSAKVVTKTVALAVSGFVVDFYNEVYTDTTPGAGVRSLSIPVAIGDEVLIAANNMDIADSTLWKCSFYPLINESG